jgi:hypothetical protein
LRGGAGGSSSSWGTVNTVAQAGHLIFLPANSSFTLKVFWQSSFGQRMVIGISIPWLR